MAIKESIKVEFLKGVDFLNQMTLEINSKIGASYTFVGRYIKGSHKIKTVSLCYYNEIIENIEYDGSDTPCGDILKSNECVFQNDIQAKFPKDHFITKQGFTSYIRYPLFSVKEGEVIGLLVSLFKGEVKKPDDVMLRFKLLAPRIEMELDRSILSFDLKKSETKYKKLYKELVKSNLTLEKAQEVGKMGSWELDINTGKLDWSKQIYSIFKLDPSEFEPTYEAFLSVIHPDDRNAVNEAYTNSVKNRKPYEIEHRLLFKDGSIAYVSEKCETFYYKNGDPKKSIGTVLDITERKIFEERNQKSEEKYRTIFNSLIDVYYKTNANGEVIDVSPSIKEVAGYEPDKFIGRNILDFYKDSVEREVFLKNIKEKGEVTNYYFTMLHKNGSEIEIELSSKVLLDDKGEYSGTEGMARDITERKRIEDNLSKVNRLYATLVQVNQVIVRESDEQSLFQQICNIAVEYGKFRLAWLGVVDEKSKTIKSTAHSGVGSDYLKDIHLSIKKGKLAKGPTGRAVTEKKSIIFNNLESNPDFAPWRDQAIEKGYRSSAAFPIWLNNKVIAVLNVYAVETHFFDKEEVKLLEELTMDISFALEKMKAEELLEIERKLTLQAQFVGEEIEKNRISTELHDGLGQILTAAKLSLAALTNKTELDNSVKDQLLDIKNLINDANSETRRIAMHLLPRLLDDYGLEAAVEKMLSNLGALLNIETSFICDSKMNQSKKNHIAIYRIIQEAINNSAKYSNCTKLSVICSVNDSYATFTVADNGIGFSPEKVKGGLGLKNMKQRAKSIGGQLIVESKINKGTSIICKIPEGG